MNNKARLKKAARLLFEAAALLDDSVKVRATPELAEAMRGLAADNAGWGRYWSYLSKEGRGAVELIPEDPK